MDEIKITCSGKPRVLCIGQGYFDVSLFKGEIETYGYEHKKPAYDHVALAISDEVYRPSRNAHAENASRVTDDPEKGVGFDAVYLDLREFTSEHGDNEKDILRYASEKLRYGGILIVQGKSASIAPITEMLNYRLSDIVVRKPSSLLDFFVVTGVLKSPPRRDKLQAELLTVGLSKGTTGADFFFFDKEYAIERHFKREPAFLSYLYDDAEMNKFIPTNLLGEVSERIVPVIYQTRLPIEPAVGHVPKLVVDGMADGLIQGEDGTVILTMGIPEKVTTVYTEENVSGEEETYRRTANHTYMRSITLVGPVPGKISNVRFV